ncbi:MAG: tetratricopeptide repeat protein [Verrucomicrobiae bacterium]|nr:tetratricopeptide repeat protein [Verrucomicrobiae bacterium]
MSKADRSNQMIWGMALLLCLLCLAVYWPVTSYDFVGLDDGPYVFDNEHVNEGLTWAGLKWLPRGIVVSLWHPVTNLSHMLDCQFFGLNAGAHHMSNLVLHVFNVLLLFLLLNRMTGACLRSAFVAALFAIHPINVDSVAWISQRKNVLSTFFWLSCFWSYLYYLKGPSGRRMALLALLLLLGLMSKIMLITLPVTLVLLDIWPLKRWKTNEPFIKALWISIQEKAALFVIAIAFGLETLRSQGGSGAMIPQQDFPFLWRIAYAANNYVFYLQKMIWPTDLSVIYPRPTTALPLGIFLVDVILLIAISIGAIITVRRFRYILAGWLWYLIILAPVCGLFAAGMAIKADRFAYVPLVGIFIILVWGITDLSRGSKQWQRMAFITGLLVVGVLAVVARRQLTVWENSTTLFQHAVNVTANNASAHNNLGVALKDNDQTDEALYHYLRAFEIEPRHFLARNNAARILDQQGQTDKAIILLKESIEITPWYAMAYFHLGEIAFRSGNIAEGTRYFEQGFIHAPRDEEARNNLGNLFAGHQMFAEAFACYRQALALNPGHLPSRCNLANILVRSGKPQEAIVQYREVLRMDPNAILALNPLAWLLTISEDPQIRNPKEAVQLATRAVELDRTGNPLYASTLAAAYAATGDYEKAATLTCAQLARLKPDASSLKTELQRRLKLYVARQPYCGRE